MIELKPFTLAELQSLVVTEQELAAMSWTGGGSEKLPDLIRESDHQIPSVKTYETSPVHGRGVRAPARPREAILNPTGDH